MNVFEHVAVAFSMVLSLAVVRLLDGVRPAVAPGRRYWIHALWLVQKLFNLAFSWWVFWSLREGVSWTVASFIWILIVPSLLFLQATALATTDPGSVVSFRDHFWSIRRWFFTVDVVLMVHSMITASFLRGIPILHPLRGLQAAGLTISVLGAVSASPALHAAIAPVALALQWLGLGSLFFLPPDLGAAQ